MQRDDDGFILPPEQGKRARRRENMREEPVTVKTRKRPKYVMGTRGGGNNAGWRQTAVRATAI